MGGRLAEAIAAIDAANAEDPEVLVVDGQVRPKELAHSALMEAWVRRLDPGATEVQLLAARAAHLRRWVVPRSSYPEGRAGYLRWRTAQKRRHAEEVGEILRRCGYDDATIERVGAIVRKDGLGTDPAVQVHEDALCLVFLQTQLSATAAKVGDDKAVSLLAKTVAKMSERARAAAAELPLSEDERVLLGRALGS